MTDNIYKQNVYSYEKPCWHSKGEVGKEKETCVQVYGRMFPVQFEKREYSVVLNGESRGSGQFAIVRISDSKERIIGTTKDQYQLVQPLEYCEAYDKASGANSYCETLGFLGTDAEKMFITSKLPQISIFGDLIDLYQFLAVGFDGMFGAHQYVTNVRIVCQNTMNLGIANSESTQNHGRGSLYSGRHNQPNHMRDLEAWLQYVQKESENAVEITKNLFCKMESTPMTVDEAFGLTKKIYVDPDTLPDFFPDQLRSEKQEVIDKKLEKASESRDLVMDLFKGNGIQISKTSYGLLNSVTEAENHHKPSKKNSTYSLLMGNKHLIMNGALNIITDWTNDQNN
jgi:hypothetical protein